MARPIDPKAAEESRNHMRRQVALMRSLKECPGWREWMLPIIEKLKSSIAEKIAAGECMSFDEYQASVGILKTLDTDIFKPLREEETRLLSILGKAPE